MTEPSKRWTNRAMTAYNKGISAESGEPRTWSEAMAQIQPDGRTMAQHLYEESGDLPRSSPVVSPLLPPGDDAPRPPSQGADNTLAGAGPAESGEPPTTLRKGYIPDHITHEQAEAALAYWVNRAGIAESRIAELERAMEEIRTTNKFRHAPTNWGIKYLSNKIDELCGAALKDKQ